MCPLHVTESLPTNRTHTAVENGDDALRFFQPEVVIEAVDKMVKIVRAEP